MKNKKKKKKAYYLSLNNFSIDIFHQQQQFQLYLPDSNHTSITAFQILFQLPHVYCQLYRILFVKFFLTFQTHPENKRNKKKNNCFFLFTRINSVWIQLVFEAVIITFFQCSFTRPMRNLDWWAMGGEGGGKGRLLGLLIFDQYLL